MKYFFLFLSLFIYGLYAFGALSEPDRSLIPARNLLKNPGFEQGLHYWTKSAGTFTLTNTASLVGSGNDAAIWAPSASSQTLTSTAVAIPAGLYNRNGVVSCNFKSATSAHLLQAYDGTNILASGTVNNSTSYVRTSVNFIFPSSGNIQLRIVSAASDTFEIDDCYVGGADTYNISQASQATLYGSLKWPGGNSLCKWQFVGNYPQDAAAVTCTSAVTTGNASAPGTTIPAVVFSTLPAGDFEVIACGGFIAAATNTDTLWRIYDGTNYSGSLKQWGSTAGTGFYGGGCVTGRFSYTTSQSNITFKIRGGDNSGSGTTSFLDNRSSNGDMEWYVYKFPSSTDTVFTPAQVANSWAGYSNCSGTAFSVTSVSYANFAGATCTLTETNNANFGTVTGSTTLPQITFTPSRAGRYHVCAKAVAVSATSGADASLKLWDGTTVVHQADWRVPAANNRLQIPVCGVYNATSTASVTLSLQGLISSGTLSLSTSNQLGAIYWEIFQIDQQMPMPLIVGAVTSGSSGVERIERAYVANNGTCSISTQSNGGWTISSTPANGGCSITIPAGNFSAAPTCTLTPFGARRICDFSTVSSTSLITQCMDNSAVNQNVDTMILCVGPK